jgi:hypothetical protein
MKRGQLIAAVILAFATSGDWMFAGAQTGGGRDAKPFLGTFTIEDRHSSNPEYTGSITITQRPKGYEVSGTLTHQWTKEYSEKYSITGSYSPSKGLLSAKGKGESGGPLPNITS